MNMTMRFGYLDIFTTEAKDEGKPIENIGLFFFQKSREWQYIKNAALTAIVDGRKATHGTTD